MDWHDPSNIVRRGKPIDSVDRAARMINDYERGHFTADETVMRVIDCISPTNAKRIVPLLPDAVMRALRELVSGTPQTDNDWETFRIYSIQSYCGRINEREYAETDHEREAREAKERANFRFKMEALQAYFASSESA